MSSFKKVSHATMAFFYMAFAVSPVMADDSEIYLAGSSGTSGNPNVLMLIDTSGSMAYGMSTTSTATATLENQRMTHLKTAVGKILDTLPGNIRVGLARYNSDGNGGRIIYPLAMLSGPARADGSGFSKFTYRTSAAADDVDQLGLTNGSTLQTGSKVLAIGSTTESTYKLAANSDAAVECNSGTNPTIFIGGAGSTNNATMKKGLYLGNHPVETSNAYCQSSLGLRYTGLNIAKTSSIASAKLVFTHYRINNNESRNRNIGGSYDSSIGPDSNRVMNLVVSVEQNAAPVTYSTATAGSVVGRTYTGSPTANGKIVEDEFFDTREQLEIDVTQLLKNRQTAAAAALATVAFRVRGTSGNGGNDAPIIRRLYALSDSSTYAPMLVVSYQALGDAGRNAGLRFQGVGVPKGAVVDSAHIELTAAGSSDTTSTFKAFIDNANVPSSPVFASGATSTSHLGGARWGISKAPIPDGSASGWVQNEVYKIDVTSLVQSQVNLAGYCGGTLNTGNTTMSFKLQLNSGNALAAYSYEGDSDKAPRLVIRYAAPDAAAASCTRISRMASSGADAANYATQAKSTDNNALGGNANSATAIQFAGTVTMAAACTANCAALRFPSVDVPKNAVVSKVTLSLVGANSNTGSIKIMGVASGDRDVFTSAPSGRISSMALGTKSATLSVPGTLVGASTYANGVRYELSSADLTAVVQDIVEQGAWVRGNAVGLVLGYTGDSSDRPGFHTTDRDSRYPRLTITFTSTDPADAQITAREDLMTAVDALTAKGGTPLNASYYETALYMLAEQAKYGRAYSPKYDSDWLLYPDAADAMTSGNMYQSPVGEASCQSNNIIALTDGDPSGDALDTKGGSCSTAFGCMQATAKYLKETGRNGYSIKTHTIGFGPVASGGTDASGNPILSAAGKSLLAVASASDGKFFAASDSDALLAGFQAIFAGIADSNGAMAAPGIAVSQLNRSEHLDQLYYGVFKPKASKRWAGNLKRYRLGEAAGDDAILDAAGNPAVDAETKYFKETAQSWWSATPDGNEAAVGGVAGKQTSAITVYTNTGSTMGVLDAANPPAVMGTGSASSPNKNVQWVQGIDVDNENVAGSGYRQALGAPIHAQPTLVSYGNSNEDFAVFVGTNDGLLYSINANKDKGTINWAWLPEDLQNNVAALRENVGMSAGEAPLYGLDGTWSLAALDSNTKLLVGGMRQGGTNYYAIQLPSTQTGAPSLKWSLKNLTGARTWSQPIFGKVRYKGNIVNVVVFGGGLDHDVYEVGGSSATSSGSDKGNSIYIVNANTGTVLETISTSENAAMKYSIPGAPRLVDKDGDSLFDHIYVGDMGGQVFRADINNAASASDLVKGVALVAKLGVAENSGKSNDRRFYETPAVAYVQDTNGIYAAIVIGSGNRNFPKSDKDAVDRVYMIKDYDAAQFGIATKNLSYVHSDLDDLTTPKALTNGKKGWYITLPNTGEKVLSSPFIFSNQITDASGNKTLSYNAYFNTFRPGSTSSTSCTPVAGATFAWIVNLFNATAAQDLNGDGTISGADRSSADSVVNGISGSDVGLIRPTDPTGGTGGGSGSGPGPCPKKMVRVTGTKGAGAGCVPEGFDKIQRTRWFDNPNAGK